MLTYRPYCRGQKAVRSSSAINYSNERPYFSAVMAPIPNLTVKQPAITYMCPRDNGASWLAFHHGQKHNVKGSFDGDLNFLKYSYTLFARLTTSTCPISSERRVPRPPAALRAETPALRRCAERPSPLGIRSKLIRARAGRATTTLTQIGAGRGHLAPRPLTRKACVASLAVLAARPTASPTNRLIRQTVTA